MEHVQSGLEREAERPVDLVCARGHAATRLTGPPKLCILMAVVVRRRSPGDERQCVRRESRVGEA